MSLYFKSEEDTMKNETPATIFSETMKSPPPPLFEEKYLPNVGMHDIYRTDKLSTDMGENYVIFIAPINKWNPITRSDKVACW